MLKIGDAERFEDVGDADSSGEVEYAYRGYHYRVSGGEAAFLVRTYDDRPGEITVVAPANALSLPQARELVDALVRALGVRRVSFYSHKLGYYAPIHLDSLHFEYDL
jgi:hypothetical protein